MTTPAKGSGVLTAGGAVILTGPALRTALRAVLTATRARQRFDPPNSAYAELAEHLLRAMSAEGHPDVRHDDPLHTGINEELPTVPIDEAARQLGLSQRQTRRLAPKLGGKRVAGRWLLDQLAIDEHVEGAKQSDR